MKKIEFSISDMAQVVLTDEGKKALKHFSTRYPHGAPDDLKSDDQGVLRQPLWLVMHIFGSSFEASMESLFVNSRIQIEIPDDNSCLYIEEDNLGEYLQRTL